MKNGGNVGVPKVKSGFKDAYNTGKQLEMMNLTL